MKFKVGDKVKLKSNFRSFGAYKKESESCKEEISKNLGHIITVAREASDADHTVRISCDDNHGYYTIPQDLLELAPVKTYPVEVKRQARVGELVKIVAPTLTGGMYKLDDIRKVVNVRSHGVDIRVMSGGTAFVYHEEYIVLGTGSKDVHEVVTGVQAKVGDTIKIVNSSTSRYQNGEVLVVTDLSHCSDGVYCGRCGDGVIFPKEYTIIGKKAEKNVTKKVEEKIMNNEMFGFKIGDKVFCNGDTKVQTVLAFDKDGDKRMYVSRDGDYRGEPNFADRKIGRSWEVAYPEAMKKASDPTITRFGFTIGETVICGGKKCRVLAFDKDGDRGVYLSTGNGYPFVQPSFADRKLTEPWTAEPVERISKAPVEAIPEVKTPRVGDYAEVVINVGGASKGTITKIIDVMGNGRSNSVKYEYVSNGKKATAYGTVGSNMKLVKKPIDYVAKVGDTVMITEYCGGDPVGALVVVNTVERDGRIYYNSTAHSGCNFTAHGGSYKLVIPTKSATTKRVWTEAEIQDAKIILAEQCVAWKLFIEPEDGESKAMKASFKFGGRFEVAKASHNDEPNRYVGAMVAACKLTGRTLPSWVTK